MLRRFSPLFVVPALVLCRPAAADAVDDAVQAAMSRGRVPGVVVVVTRDDRPVKRAAYGEADRASHAPVTPEMFFETGSIGKSYTAAVALQEVEKGTLSLDDSVRKHVPDAPAAWDKITLRHLIGQTSGLKEYALLPGLRLTERWTAEDWKAKFKTLPLDFEPGTAWAYSNSNFFLLGLILEKVTGKPVTELITERVFRPLGMSDSYWAKGAEKRKAAVAGYYPLPDGQIIDAPETPAIGAGDGGVVQTADDLLKFEKGLREGKLVRPETLKKMQEPGRLPNGRKTPYGMGLFIRSAYGVRTVGHPGTTGGFSASLVRYPDKRMTVVVLCNLANLPPDDIARAVAEAAEPSLKPDVSEHPDPDAKRTATLRKALEALAKREVPADLLDPEFAARLGSSRGQMGMAAYQPFASISSMAFLHEEKDDPDTMVRYRVRTEDGRRFVVGFAVTPAGKVYGVGARLEAPPAA